MNRLLAITIALIAAYATPAAAQALPFAHDLGELTKGLRLPLRDERRVVRPSEATLRQRVAATPTDPTVDPVELHIPSAAKARTAYLTRLAAPGKLKALQRHVGNRTTVRLDAKSLALVNEHRVLDTLSQTHRHLSLSTTPLRKSPALRKSLLGELSRHLDPEEVAAVDAAIEDEREIAVDALILPRIARASVGRFTKYRGPNCFRTALSFQDPKLPSSPAVNSKAEVGFHDTMINNDELWFALSRMFVEVDTARERLRYGDVIVFFDVPNEKAPIDWRSLKHASTYLFGDYAYSKESYAANSPHTVKRLADEWATWQKRLPHFGVKVYRKAF